MKSEKVGYNSEPKFDFQSSQIWRIIIPLPNYKYFHRASEPERLDPNYIERSPFSSRLRGWLTDNSANGGTYLITGYRGAGKSSFVSNVISDLKNRQNIKNLLFYSLLLLLIGLIGLLINHLAGWGTYPLTIKILAGMFAIAFVYISIEFYLKYKNRFHLGIENFVHECWRQKSKTIIYFLKRIWTSVRSKHAEEEIMEIKINLGHEVVHERDVLCLLAHSLKDKYEDHVSQWKTYSIRKIGKVIMNLLITIVMFVLFKYLMAILNNLLTESWMFDSDGNKFFLSSYWPESCDYITNLQIKSFNDLGTIWDNFKSWPEIDYVVFAILFIFSHSARKKLALFFTKSFHFPIGNNLLAIDKLSKLCDRIDASVSSDNSTLHDLTSKYSFSLFRRKRLTYPIASEREIEQELISALKIIKNSCYSPKIIIVFDELDKADASKNQEGETVDEVLPEFERSNVDMTGGGSTRKRKKSVLSLIANMKFFLSSSEVYFIFIAGRELYDAWLADITDRDFTIASIFNGIINVDSFLSSSRSHNNITLLTEQYLCTYLLPPKREMKYPGLDISKIEPDDYYSLKTYGYYLETLDKKEEKCGKKDDEKEIGREYKLLLLYRFITYLAFVSNGSPKKITSLIQQYVCSTEYLEANKKVPYDISEEQLKKHEYYLSFGFYEQQKIGFIHYLISPVMLAIINRSNVYGDKLLVSASFIIGHIFKHFNNGFTWQNLELTPELLDINKTPELREYVSSIIDFLGRTHISPIMCGLFTHKFPLKISEEIAYHSKISSEISALFNFSLDESLLVKRYNMRMLDYYSKHADNCPYKNLYAMASIHHSLGDIYLMEENYTKAIWEFQYAIKTIKGNNSSSSQDMFFLIRTMLKLGLAYEKRHTDNSAYLIYTDIIEILTKVKNDGKIDGINTDENSPNSVLLDLRLIFQPLLAQLYSLEKVGTEGITSAHILTTINKFKDLNRVGDISETKAAEEEKESVVTNEERNGIIQPTGNEFKNTILASDFYQKLGDILYMKNYQDITPKGDVIYPMKEECQHLAYALENGRRTPCYACHCYAESLKLLMGKLPEEAGGGCKNADYSYTVQVLKLLYNFEKKQRNYLLLRQENYLVSIATALEGRGNTLYSCANNEDQITKDFLDVFFEIVNVYSVDANDKEITKERLKELYSSFEERYSYAKAFNQHLEKAVMYYWCAAVFYEKASRLSESVKCYKQILHLFNSYITAGSNSVATVFRGHLDNIDKRVLHIALIRQYAHYENSNVYEIQQLKWIHDCKMYDDIPLNQLSVFPDIEELLYLFYMIRYHCITSSEKHRDISNAAFMGPHRALSTLTVNVHNLHFKTLLNIKRIQHSLSIKWDLFTIDNSDFYTQLLKRLVKIESDKNEELLHKEIVDPQHYHELTKELEDEKNKFLDYFESLLVDSLFCLTQILEMVSPLKNTTLFSHSYIAELYELLRGVNCLSEFLYFLYCYAETEDQVVKGKTKGRLMRITSIPEQELENLLDDLSSYMQDIKRSNTFYDSFNSELKRSNINYVVSSYLGECAIRHYTKTIEQHNEGKTYYETIRNLYFLDDDLHNDTCQFFYANERYLLNCGYIEDRIRKLKKLFNGTSLYQSKWYL